MGKVTVLFALKQRVYSESLRLPLPLPLVFFSPKRFAYVHD